MSYTTDYQFLRKRFEPLANREKQSVQPDERTEILRVPFRSSFALPAATKLPAENAPARVRPSSGIESLGSVRDEQVSENRDFDYYLLRTIGGDPRAGTILLFHGLNERSWDKYLPWAQELNRRTGKRVVLFPIAFHMNRAPKEWSSPRSMAAVAEERRRLYPSLHEVSLANAALSTRLQLDPRRFLYSGYQTFEDVVALVRGIRSGDNAQIPPGGGVDLFGYSIGAFLTEFLLLGNPEGLFGDSRAFLFCGGATLDGMNPVSRYIMDSGAGASMSEYYNEELSADVESGSPVRWIFSRLQSLSLLFRSLISAETFRGIRDGYLSAVRGRLRAVALAGDSVIPHSAVGRAISTADAPLRVLDFPFPYTHVQPFPLIDRLREEVDSAFAQVFAEAASVYS